MKSFSKELGCLAQGFYQIKCTNIIHFTLWNKLPKGKIPIYICICCNHCLQKEDLNRTRITIRGNRITYSRDTATPTISIITAKMNWNSTISIPNKRYTTIDIKDFYLNLELNDYEYIYIDIDLIS